jgi:ABC-type multidrug transport system ATPase subunit
MVIQKGRIVAQGTEEELVSTMRRATEIALLARGSAEAVERAVRSVPGVTRVDVSAKGDGIVAATVAVSSTSFSARAPDDATAVTDAREALAAALVGAGIGLREMKEKRSSEELEAAFIQLTRSQEGEAAPSVAASSRQAPDARSDEATKAAETAATDDTETDEEAS